MRSLLGSVLFLTISLSASISWSVPLLQEPSIKELVPLANWQRQFKITEGKDLGNVVPLTSRADLSNEKRWKLTFGNYAGIYLVQGVGGAVTMERLDLLKSRHSIIYEPALPIIPSDINSANVVLHETGYKMFNLDTGKFKRS
jgi:hypothetical protein